MSINRCPKSEDDRIIPFLFSEWKLGSVTPGASNDCTKAQYILEHNMQALNFSTYNIEQVRQEGPSTCNKPEFIYITATHVRDNMNVVLQQEMEI